MIVLDANVLIGLLDRSDPRHSASLGILDDFVTEGYGASAVTVAEALVHPVRAGIGERAADALSSIGLSILPIDSDDALPLARIRARHRIRMPDAVALHAAIRGGGTLATFDTALAAAARNEGVVVVGTP
ncbi:MAG: hypothetical protein RI885_266 [Actinomycetota bacterium]